MQTWRALREPLGIDVLQAISRATNLDQFQVVQLIDQLDDHLFRLHADVEVLQVVEQIDESIDVVRIERVAIVVTVRERVRVDVQRWHEERMKLHFHVLQNGHVLDDQVKFGHGKVAHQGNIEVLDVP